MSGSVTSGPGRNRRVRNLPPAWIVLAVLACVLAGSTTAFARTGWFQKKRALVAAATPTTQPSPATTPTKPPTTTTAPTTTTTKPATTTTTTPTTTTQPAATIPPVASGGARSGGPVVGVNVHALW